MADLDVAPCCEANIVARYFPAAVFSFRRAAQYFFIRSETAFRSAADQLDFRRDFAVPFGVAVPFNVVVVLEDALRAPRRAGERSGNARRSSACSRFNSSRRA